MPFYFIRSLHVELYSCTKSRGLNRLWTHLGSNYFRYHEITVIQNVAKQRQHPSGQARRSNVFLLTKVYMFPLKPILNSMWQLKVTRSKLYMDEGNRISFSSSKRPTVRTLELWSDIVIWFLFFNCFAIFSRLCYDIAH
jgi:hypothetical protein